MLIPDNNYNFWLLFPCQHWKEVEKANNWNVEVCSLLDSFGKVFPCKEGLLFCVLPDSAALKSRDIKKVEFEMPLRH